MNPEQLGYIAIAAAIIGLVVRLLKQDVAFLPTVPSKWRPVVALALGLVAGVLEALAQGTPWKMALFNGIAAAGTAIVGHNVLIETMRGGRELGQSKLVDPSDAPTSPVLPKDPPSVPAILFLVGFAIFGARVLVGCASSQKATSYALELEACEQVTSSCTAYVQCRARVAAKFDRPFTGYCDDGGAK